MIFVIIIPNLLPFIAIFNMPGTKLTALKTLSYTVFTKHYAVVVILSIFTDKKIV